MSPGHDTKCFSGFMIWAALFGFQEYEKPNRQYNAVTTAARTIVPQSISQLHADWHKGKLYIPLLSSVI